MAVILIVGQCIKFVLDLNMELFCMIPEFRCVVQSPSSPFFPLSAAQFHLHPCQQKVMVAVGICTFHHSGVEKKPLVFPIDYDVVKLVTVVAIRCGDWVPS